MSLRLTPASVYVRKETVTWKMILIQSHAVSTMKLWYRPIDRDRVMNFEVPWPGNFFEIWLILISYWLVDWVYFKGILRSISQTYTYAMLIYCTLFSKQSQPFEDCFSTAPRSFWKFHSSIRPISPTLLLQTFNFDVSEVADTNPLQIILNEGTCRQYHKLFCTM